MSTKSGGENDLKGISGPSMVRKMEIWEDPLQEMLDLEGNFRKLVENCVF